MVGMLSYRTNRPALVPSSPGSPSGTVTQHTRAGFLPMLLACLERGSERRFPRSLNRTVQSSTRIGMWATRYPSPWASKADASPGHRQSQGSDRSEPSQRIDGLGIGAAVGGRCPARTPLQADPTGSGAPSIKHSERTWTCRIKVVPFPGQGPAGRVHCIEQPPSPRCSVHPRPFGGGRALGRSKRRTYLSEVER